MADPLRQAVLDQITAFPSDAVRVLAYRELREVERVAQDSHPPVLMCACDDWETCAHPWPQRMRLEPVRG